MAEGNNSAPHEPVQSLVDRRWESGLAEDREHVALIEELGKALDRLSEVALDAHQRASQETDRRVELERELAAARQQISDLETQLAEQTSAAGPSSTESANTESTNQAKLKQSAAAAAQPAKQPSAPTEPNPVQEEPSSIAMPLAAANTAAGSDHGSSTAAESVAERFGRLRREQATRSVAG